MEIMTLKVTSPPTFLSSSFKLSNMAHVYISEACATFKRLVDLDEILYGVMTSISYILFIPVPSTIPIWQTLNFWGGLQRNPLVKFEWISGFG
jgi:hypothetical protein